jgi:hypothetical protein
MNPEKKLLRAEANDLLEPELRELCSDLTATQRARAAAKFARWSDQLAHSALRLDANIMTLREPPMVKRGFFLLNIAGDRQRKMRALARQCGVPLRSVLGWSFTHAYQCLEEKVRLARTLGVSPRDCWELTEGNERN